MRDSPSRPPEIAELIGEKDREKPKDKEKGTDESALAELDVPPS